MSTYLKLSALALTAAVFTVILRKQSPDYALLITLLGCVIGAVLIVTVCRPVVEFIRKLAAGAELDGTVVGPVLKCVGIGLLTQLTASVCKDAEQTALAGIVELGGGILCVCVSLPLMESVLSMIEQLAGQG